MKKILIYGPQGSGKTSFAWNYARMLSNDNQILGVNYAQWTTFDYSNLKVNPAVKVLIIDEYPQCASISFDPGEIYGLDYMIVCVQRDKDYRFPQPDITYIKMPYCIEVSFEQLLLSSFETLVGKIRKNPSQQEYNVFTGVTEDFENNNMIEYYIVATRRPKPQNEEV